MTELNDDDVLYAAEPSLLFVGTTTFKVEQLKKVLNKQIANLTGNSVGGDYWLERGIPCELLRASSGGGWKKARICLRLEVVLDESEPVAPNLNLLETDLYPEQ
jgi:hypothetical protein